MREHKAPTYASNAYQHSLATDFVCARSDVVQYLKSKNFTLVKESDLKNVS